MKISASQPEFFPYLGYFERMAAVDLYVIVDDVIFQGKGSFQRRNKLESSNEQIKWVTLPIKKNSKHELIRNVEIGSWDKKNRGFFESILENYISQKDISRIINTEKLIDVNMLGIEICREAFGITTPIIFSSELGVQGKKADYVVDLCRKVGATEFVAGQGAKNGYLGNYDWPINEIPLYFHKPLIETYDSSLVYLASDEDKVRAKKLIADSLNQKMEMF